VADVPVTVSVEQLAALNAIRNPLDRAVFGARMFGKRYMRDVAPLTDEFDEEFRRG
jgi:hypothetical protein